MTSLSRLLQRAEIALIRSLISPSVSRFYAVAGCQMFYNKQLIPPFLLIGQIDLMTHCDVSNFSRMRSKGSRFTLGVWGLRVCSLDVAEPFATVRNRPQPFATVRMRSVWPCLCKFCRGNHFWSFQTCRCFVSRGRRGTS